VPSVFISNGLPCLMQESSAKLQDSRLDINKHTRSILISYQTQKTEFCFTKKYFPFQSHVLSNTYPRFMYLTPHWRTKQTSQPLPYFPGAEYSLPSLRTRFQQGAVNERQEVLIDGTDSRDAYLRARRGVFPRIRSAVAYMWAEENIPEGCCGVQYRAILNSIEGVIVKSVEI
jgi:hypothetical protein